MVSNPVRDLSWFVIVDYKWQTLYGTIFGESPIHEVKDISMYIYIHDTWMRRDWHVSFGTQDLQLSRIFFDVQWIFFFLFPSHQSCHDKLPFRRGISQQWLMEAMQTRNECIGRCFHGYAWCANRSSWRAMRTPSGWLVASNENMSLTSMQASA